jgi:hypothetical protein
MLQATRLDGKDDGTDATSPHKEVYDLMDIDTDLKLDVSSSIEWTNEFSAIESMKKNQEVEMCVG